MRVILHVDMDAFYTQVEHVRLNIPLDIPLAVQQWHGLIAVNYAARSKGISRHDNVTDALEKCPELKLVHVATYSKGESVPKYHDKVSYQTHKVSLDFYRKASQQIMRIIKRFCPLFQRASIDEAYADITSAVDARIKQVNINDSIDWSSNNTFYIGKDDNSCGLDDWRLYLGSEICQEIRDAIYKECGYTCSAGIAHNKTLAKLVSSMHKPNKQSVLCQSQVLTFLKDLPASKIKGLGGKLGAEIEAEYGMKSCGDLWTLSIEDFMKDTSSGSWIYHIIRGIDDDPVVENSLVKSMAACKTFRPNLKSAEQIKSWIEILSAELYARIMEEYETNSRKPKTLVLCMTLNKVQKTRSGPIGLPDSPSMIANKGISLFNLEKEEFPCSRIEFSVTNLEQIDAKQGLLSSWLEKDLINCPECFKLIRPDRQLEHSDFHFALRLSEEQKQRMNFQSQSNCITFGSITVLKRHITPNVKLVFNLKVPLSFPVIRDGYDPTVPPVATKTTSFTFGSLPSTASQPPPAISAESASEPDIDPTRVDNIATAKPKTWASLLKTEDDGALGLSNITMTIEPMEQPKGGFIFKKIVPNLDFNPRRIVPRGLVNNENMCYMNSILQPLIRCPPFYNYFDDIAKSGRPTGNLVTALIEFLGEFKHNLLAVDDTPVSQNISDVLYHLKKFDTQKVIRSLVMKKGRQEDAEEFLGFLLDGLEEELVSLKSIPPLVKNNWTEIGPNRKPIVVQKASNDSPISLLFGGSMRSVVKAFGNKDSVTIQPFQSLQLDITVSPVFDVKPSHVNSVADALHHLTEPELLHGFNRSNNTPVDATKQTLIEALPPILILHLKRFVFEPGNQSTHKLCKFVNYDSHLTITPEMLSHSSQAIPSSYYLSGVVYHHGKLLTGGHYTCHVLIQNQEWMLIDDTVLVKSTAEEVIAEKDDRQVYMLFYTRKT